MTRSMRLSSRWQTGIATALSIAASFVALDAVAREPVRQLGAASGGPFWHVPDLAWVAVALLAALCLVFDSPIARLAAIVSFGAATMGSLGYLEPLGVFHDSWQNVGLGQLAVSSEYADAVRQVHYVASSPGSFLLYGVLRGVFTDTPGFLRVYPVLCVLLYSAGLYALAVAFVDAHLDHLRVDRTRFGLMSVFAFLALSPLFWVRINPAPQSLAFALMPFCLAALINAAASVRFRIVALVTFGVIVLIHPITATTIVSLGVMWLLADWLIDRFTVRTPIIAANTVVLYVCLFLSWLIYIGLWIISTGGSFVQRMIDVLNSGQHATVIATATHGLEAFIWLHRAALVGGALLVVIGLAMTRSARRRIAGVRLIAWLATAAVWLPLLLFGEFADRGPLFASLPAALIVGLALSVDLRRGARWLIGILMLVTTLTNYITAYPNHVGEVIMESEVSAFEVIAKQSGDRRIAYGYVPTLAGGDLLIYTSGRIRAYAIGAADFNYDQLKLAGTVIVISDQMREAAAVRSSQALDRLERFEAQLLEAPTYELIFDNGDVRAFRAR